MLKIQIRTLAIAMMMEIVRQFVALAIQLVHIWIVVRGLNYVIKATNEILKH
ncbi:MAG TPA: hypothetical protein VK040_04850 [Balneolaceae bacterium]|nr:hypothetical protein [Balneolaceae bacterium]